MPFLSQELFSTSSNATNYVIYNQTAILNNDGTINPAGVVTEGLPQLTSSYLAYLVTSNMGLTAAFVHMFLWNRDDLKAGWLWVNKENFRRMLRPEFWRFWKNVESPEARLQRKYDDPNLDPHYKLMLRNKYAESPNWWWASVAIFSFVLGIGCLYAMKSTLPWWGFILATILTFLLLLVLGTQMGLTVSASRRLRTHTDPVRDFNSIHNQFVKWLLDTSSPTSLWRICTSLATPLTQ